jgi:hypothetical protein
MIEITDPAVLRASHIVPWAECDTDAHRLDVHSGLLLSALWDAAFDAGLASFDNGRRLLCSASLTPLTRRWSSVSTDRSTLSDQSNFALRSPIRHVSNGYCRALDLIAPAP